MQSLFLSSVLFYSHSSFHSHYQSTFFACVHTPNLSYSALFNIFYFAFFLGGVWGWGQCATVGKQNHMLELELKKQAKTITDLTVALAAK